jgi:hypothetical protein
VLESISYVAVLVVAGLQIARRQRDPALIPGVPLAIASMHLAWGSAFLWSMMTR